MKIYLDQEYVCHVQDDGTMMEAECAFFDGKCNAFIEGYRYIPQGHAWKDASGTMLTGEMAAPIRDYRELDDAQRAYELEELEDMREALRILGVNVDE